MNVRLLLRVIILLLILEGNLLCSQIDIKLSTIERTIAGEQQFIKIKFIIKNQSTEDIKMAMGWEKIIYHSNFGNYLVLHVEGPIDDTIVSRPDEVLPPPGAKLAYLEIKAGETYSIESNLRAYGICSPGKYKLRAEYKGDRAPAGYLKEVIRSKDYEIEIIEPNGIDKDAYEDWFNVYQIIYEREHNKKPRKIEKKWCNFGIGCSQYYLSWLLDKYPTSTYAGWALLKCPTSLSVFLNPKLLLEEAIKIKNQKIKRLEHCTGGIEVNDKGETI